MLKLCKDCKHFSGDWKYHSIPPPPNWPSCYAKISYTDPVFGVDHYESCKTARVTFCGPDARLFEPKPYKPTIFEKLFKL